MTMKAALTLAMIATLPLASSADTFEELAEKCAPAVSVDTLSALVKTESNFNPFAIGVVGGSVEQPKSLQDALLKVSKLVANDRSFSVGLAQINSGNFDALGLTAEQLFDPCTNLQAAAQILGRCYMQTSAKYGDNAKALGAALSCYYAGNEHTGFEHGYVAKVAKNAPPVKIPSIRLLSAAGTGAETQDTEAPSLIVSADQTNTKTKDLIF